MADMAEKMTPTLDGKLRCLQTLLCQMGANTACEAVGEARDVIASAHAQPAQAAISCGETSVTAVFARMRQLISRADAARNFPHNTCATSRWVQEMGETLAAGEPYPALTEEPRRCAEAMLSVVASLYEARSRLAAANALLREASEALAPHAHRLFGDPNEAACIQSRIRAHLSENTP